jgi:magnesium-transporting ATPase (P-type)
MNKHDNFQVNFSLKGIASIQIGIYFMVAAYLIKNILDGFLVDDNTMGMLSAEIIEVLLISITIFTFIFSSFALYFKGRRASNIFQNKLWNAKTKTAFWIYVFSFLVMLAVSIVLMRMGYIDYITPVFLILYAILLLIFKNKERKNLLVISSICLLLAVVCFLIPTYWHSSLFILGIAHVTYGVAVK